MSIPTAASNFAAATFTFFGTVFSTLASWAVYGFNVLVVFGSNAIMVLSAE